MIIYGLHPVISFLREKPQLVKKVFISRRPDDKLFNKVKYEHVSYDELDKITKTKDHQGIACEITGFPYVDADEILNHVKKVLILDHLEDPRNFGAILRNALAFNVELIVIPKDRACDVTPTVIKASAGTAVYLNISKVTNINNFIRDLKNNFFKIFGFESNGKMALSEVRFSDKTAIVLGSEGKGIRELTKSLCDYIISIESNPKAQSLNVSSASAIVLYKLYTDYQNFV
ncbi:MAG: 23S rRNA (guanosine(2251)-2'-O)-methyltransferase RlmB [Proteobacteria bacterium]|nr:23S rRNA (guanosine(2251)-2'-O)-methyltransferase RlmB [Pseudomonadota bacterium]